MKLQKVFCIGYNKTGTTSINKMLRDFGYRMPNQSIQEKTIVEDSFRGNYKPLYELCKKYDGFQDMPFSQGVIYAIVDAFFPGSKFILTIRDSDIWFNSLTRFHINGILKKAGVNKLEDFNEHSFKDKKVYLHKNYLQNVTKRHAVKINKDKIEYDWSLVYNKSHRIDIYERRNAEIIKYFQKRPSQLLVIDITKENDNSKIVDFLGLGKNHINTIPHLNKSK